MDLYCLYHQLVHTIGNLQLATYNVYIVEYKQHHDKTAAADQHSWYNQTVETVHWTGSTVECRESSDYEFRLSSNDNVRYRCDQHNNCHFSDVNHSGIF